MRKQKSDITNKSNACPKSKCVYNISGICDEPRTNNGNSDALCFRMSNKYVIEMLKKSKEEQQLRDEKTRKYFDMVVSIRSKTFVD